MNSQVQTGAGEHRFQAEVSRVLEIVIRSLYSHRDIFLRELLSNAADALDKLRFRAVIEHALLAEDPKLEIRIIPDGSEGTLTIVDTGIGMSRDELVSNLGTIARSGTKRFLEALKANGDGQASPELIGQFGVGFYSAFIVADLVEVTSRAAGSDEVWKWSSKGSETFEIAAVSDPHPRGTKVVLHLKDDAKDLQDEWKLKDLVRRYSDFLAFPIRLLVDPKKEDGFETVNKASALWRRPKKDITSEEYAEFWRHVTKEGGEPLESIHFNIEGTISFSALLYVPKEAPFGLFEPDRKSGVRLYVKRVFIMEDCEQLVPPWLRFLRGVVDSDDLPLNVSRELLQEDRVLVKIRKSVTAKVLAALEKMAEARPDDYRKFFETFGAVLKEGFHFDRDSKDTLAKLLRAPSSKSDWTSLAEYVTRMPAEQDTIWYALGANRRSVESSPHAESLRSQGHEILWLTDPIDEWVTDTLREFEGKKLQSIMRAEASAKKIETPDEDPAQRSEVEALARHAAAMLKAEVEDVKLSTRLTESPACLTLPEGALHAHVERLLRAQRADMPAQKRIFELNPDHPLVKQLARRHAADSSSTEVDMWIRVLHDQATLAEGSPVTDPHRLARSMTDLLSRAMGAQGN